MYVGLGLLGRSRSRGADGAPTRTIFGHPRLARGGSRYCEAVRDLFARPEVHLVGGLAVERGVRDLRVVLKDMERKQRADARDGVPGTRTSPLLRLTSASQTD